LGTTGVVQALKSKSTMLGRMYLCRHNTIVMLRFQIVRDRVQSRGSQIGRRFDMASASQAHIQLRSIFHLKKLRSTCAELA